MPKFQVLSPAFAGTTDPPPVPPNPRVALRALLSGTTVRIQAYILGTGKTPRPQNIVSFYQNGTIYRHRNLPRDLGFALDGRGRILDYHFTDDDK